MIVLTPGAAKIRKEKSKKRSAKKGAVLSQYNYSKDGPLFSFNHKPEDTVLESYDISKGLSCVSIVRNRDFEIGYVIFEPDLNEFEADLLARLRTQARDLLISKEIDSSDKRLFVHKAVEYLLKSYGIKKSVQPSTVYKMRYYLERDFLGFGKIDVLMNDPEIEDISCVGYNSNVFIYHRRYANMKTSVIFGDSDELDSFTVLLAQKSGKQVSLASPILDAVLNEGSRIQLTYGKDVSTGGSSFTIRKFGKVPFSPLDLIANKTFSVDEAVYIWFAVEYNFSVLVIGGTASGKTTTLNAAAQFIPALSKVVSIEDTREINLFRENWIASVVPPSSSSLESSKHDISMFDLLKSAMRQRPEYIIVGEVRGEEAQTLFQAMNTGHTTFSSLHAGDVVEAVNRLQSPPLNVSKYNIGSLNIVISQKRMFKDGMHVRRCNAVDEIVNVSESGDLEVNNVFAYDAETDSSVFSGFSDVYLSLEKRSGMTGSEFDAEVKRRRGLLLAMLEQNIRGCDELARLLWIYRSRPDYVIENMSRLSDILT